MEMGHIELKHAFTKVYSKLYSKYCAVPKQRTTYTLQLECMYSMRKTTVQNAGKNNMLFLSFFFFLDYHMTYKLLTKYISTVYKPHAHHTRRQTLKLNYPLVFNINYT
jgi:hypothetical protein